MDGILSFFNELAPVGILVALIVGIIRVGDHLKGIRDETKKHVEGIRDEMKEHVEGIQDEMKKHAEDLRNGMEEQTRQLANHADKVAANTETQAEKRMRQLIEFLTLVFIRDEQPRQRQRGGE